MALLGAFERLSDHQPPEYQAWRKMLDVPAESVRKILLRARAGLDDTPWGVCPAADLLIRQPE